MKFRSEEYVDSLFGFIDQFPSTECEDGMKLKRATKLRENSRNVYGDIVRMKAFVAVISNDHLLASNDVIINELVKDWFVLAEFASRLAKTIDSTFKQFQEMKEYRELASSTLDKKKMHGMLVSDLKDVSDQLGIEVDIGGLMKSDIGPNVVRECFG